MRQPAREISRSDFLKLGTAGAAGAVIASTPGAAFASTREYIDYQEHRPGGFSNGRFLSRVIRTSIPYDTLIPSVDASMPSGSAVVLEARVRYGGRWSGWMSFGSYSRTDQSRSVSRANPNWRVLVDTLQSRNGERAIAYQYRLTLRGDPPPRVRSVSIVASQSEFHGRHIDVGSLKSAYGKSLPVPRFSQYDYDRGATWCSPTCVQMVLDYYDRRGSVPGTARGVYDAGAGIWGNWSYNTAYAAAQGLESRVTRFNSLQQAERWIDKGIPVITSVAWDNRYLSRRLDNASIPRATYGHLMVIVGFTRSGNVIVNDPAASPRRTVRRVYNREQFRRAWLDSDRWRGGRSDGVVYLVYPRDWSTPGSYASRGSW